MATALQAKVQRMLAQQQATRVATMPTPTTPAEQVPTGAAELEQQQITRQVDVLLQSIEADKGLIQELKAQARDKTLPAKFRESMDQRIENVTARIETKSNRITALKERAETYVAYPTTPIGEKPEAPEVTGIEKEGKFYSVGGAIYDVETGERTGWVSPYSTESPLYYGKVAPTIEAKPYIPDRPSIVPEAEPSTPTPTPEPTWKEKLAAAYMYPVVKTEEVRKEIGYAIKDIGVLGTPGGEYDPYVITSEEALKKYKELTTDLKEEERRLILAGDISMPGATAQFIGEEVFPEKRTTKFGIPFGMTKFKEEQMEIWNEAALSATNKVDVVKNVFGKDTGIGEASTTYSNEAESILNRFETLNKQYEDKKIDYDSYISKFENLDSDMKTSYDKYKEKIDTNLDKLDKKGVGYDITNEGQILLDDRDFQVASLTPTSDWQRAAQASKKIDFKKIASDLERKGIIHKEAAKDIAKLGKVPIEATLASAAYAVTDYMKIRGVIGAVMKIGAPIINPIIQEVSKRVMPHTKKLAAVAITGAVLVGEAVPAYARGGIPEVTARLGGAVAGWKVGEYLTKPLITKEPKPEVKYRAVEEIQPIITTKGGIELGKYKLIAEKPARFAYKTTKVEQLFGIKPSKYMIEPARTFVQAPTGPKDFWLGKPGVIVTKAGRIISPAYIKTQRVGARQFTIAELKGAQKALSWEEFQKLSKTQKYALRKIAEQKTQGRPVSEKMVPKIIGEEWQLYVGELQATKIMKVRITTGKVVKRIDVRFLEPGRRVSKFEMVAVAKPTKIKADVGEFYVTRAGLKEVTYPFARAAGKIPTIKGITLIRKPIDITGAGVGIGGKRIVWPGIKPKPIVRTDVFKALQIAGLKQIPVAKPIVPTEVKAAKTTFEMIKKVYPTIVGGAGAVSVYAGKGAYERGVSVVGAVPSQIVKSALGVGVIQVPKEIVKLKTPTALREKIVTEQKQVLKPAVAVVQKVAVVPKAAVVPKVALSQKLAQKLSQKLVQKQALSLKLLLIAPLAPLTPMIPKPVPIIKIPELPKPEPSKFFKAAPPPKKLAPAFVPFVKRRGVWRPVGPPLPKPKAVRRGEYVAATTAAASFKVVPTTKMVPAPKRKYIPAAKIFRPYKIKKGVPIPLFDEWIQRKTRRIISKGEVQEISMVGVRARIKKRRKEFF